MIARATRLYRVGQRVSVWDPTARKWLQGRVINAGIGRCTVAELAGAVVPAWHVVPTTPAWVRPVYVVTGRAA